MCPQCSFTLPSTTSATLPYHSATRLSHNDTPQSHPRHTIPRSSSDAPRCCSVSPRTCTAAHLYWMSTMDQPLTPTDHLASTSEPASRVAAVTRRWLTPQLTSAHPAFRWTQSPPCLSHDPTLRATQSSPSTSVPLTVFCSIGLRHVPIKVVQGKTGASGRVPCASQERCHFHCQRWHIFILSPPLLRHLCPGPHSHLKMKKNGPVRIPSAHHEHWVCSLLQWPAMS